MNKQTSDLLTILLDSPSQHFSYEELASRFQVSTRSIRNYIQSILSFLRERNRESLLSLSEKGAAFTGTPADVQFLLDNIVDEEFYLYKLSPEERVRIIFLKLLLSDTHNTVAQLMEKFNVSRNTVLKDMEQIKKLAAHYNLSFDNGLNKGYLFSVEEGQRRELIMQLVHSYADTTLQTNQAPNIYCRFLYSEYNLEPCLPELSALLLRAEKKFDLTVSDDCFEQTLLCLALTAVRNEMGHGIHEEESGSQNLTGIITYEIGSCLFRELEALYSFSLPSQELGFLVRQLYKLRFYNRFSMESMQDMRLHIALTDFLMKVGSELSIPIYEDKQTAAQLERHLKDITNARLNGIQFENEYTKQLLSEYESYYTAIKKYIHILENCAGYPYSDDTVAFILMYIVVSVDNYFQDSALPRVIVVCHTGIGTANFLAQRLKANFHLHVLAVTSSHKLPEIRETYDFDLVISTISLKEQPFPWIKVAPILEDNDIFLLQKRLMEITLKKKNRNFLIAPPVPPSRFTALPKHRILKAENIILDAPCSDWQAAVRAAAAPLLHGHAITPGYVRSILDSAQINGAYFVYCPRVALAHAGPNDGIIRFGISLARLRKPVCFGHSAHDPVSYVICLAACQNEPHLQDVLKIMDLLSRKDILSKLDQITDINKFLNYIILKETEEPSNE